MKGSTPETVPAYIARFPRAVQAALVLENIALLERVSRLARTDPLTGLLNRRELETRFDVERSRSERDDAPLSMLPHNP